MKKKKDEQTLPKSKPSRSLKLEAKILEKVNKSENRLMLYSDLYHAGHRRDLLKKAILELEAQGRIQIIAKRTEDLKFVVGILGTGKPSASEVFEPLIDKFNKASNFTKKIVIGTIYQHVTEDRLFNPDIVDFLSDTIKDKKYGEINDLAFGALYHVFNASKNFEIQPMLKKLEELKSDKQLIEALKNIILLPLTRDSDPLANKKFYSLKILSEISPKDAIETFFYNPLRDVLFTAPIHIADVIIESQRRTGYDRYKIIHMCEGLLERTTDAQKNELATLIIGRV